MEIQNKIGEQVFDKLRSKFKQITLGDDEGNSTQDPSEAVFFNFNYTDNQGHDHGNITVSLIDRTMKIYYSKNISKDLDGSELTEWYTFLQDMRKTAMSNLYGFDTHDISKSALNVADIQSTVNRNSMKENKMYGSKKRSYQDHGPAKIIVRHTENIDPEIRGSRSRKIESVFVETFEGERFKMPFNSLPGTRAMARHIGQGGRPYDDLGESITTMVNEIASLRPFVSRNRNAIYEDETTMQMVEAAREYYAETRKTLGKLKGPRGYKAYAENFEVTEAFEFIDEEAVAMRERFTKKRFSDKMEMAMPIVQKAFNLKKPKTPGIKPITEFEEWTEEVTEMPAQVIAEDSASILSDEEIEQVVNWVAGDEISDELFEKLYSYYLDNGEMPYGVAKARTGDPHTWVLDRMEQEYGHMLEAKEELCSKECCGKPVSKCLCGPECEYCDCHEKNKINEVKSGRFNSKMVGRRVKVHGQSSFGNSEHDGEIGTIIRASREHTFSQMHPFKVEYGIKLDNGERVSYRRENVSPLKDQSINEGTWAIPDTPEKKKRLNDLMSSPLPYGVDGENATSALYDLIGDDDLFDELYDSAKRFGPEADAREVVQAFLDRIISIDGNEYTAGNRIKEDVVLPKATYSDYLDVYKSSDVGGTDAAADAKRMVKSLEKKGKNADEKAAKGALKRMAEQEAKSGLHITESIKQLQREAGIIK